MNAALILPARNEAECIEAVVREARQYFHGEIIVVDNGSTDATAMRAAAAGARVIHAPEPGYGRACMAGVTAAATCDVFVFMDADGSDCPEDIPALLAEIDGGAALAIGVRTGERVAPGSIAPAARLGNWLSGTLIGLWTGRRLKDLSPLKAVTREAIVTIEPSEMTYGWTVELLAGAARRKLAIAEVETSYRHRAGGTSKVSGTLSGSFRAGWRILSVLGRVGLRSLSARMIGAAAGAAAAGGMLSVYTAWLFARGPSSDAVLVSTWLFAWPAILCGMLGGGAIGGVLSHGRQAGR